MFDTAVEASKPMVAVVSSHDRTRSLMTDVVKEAGWAGILVRDMGRLNARDLAAVLYDLGPNEPWPTLPDRVPYGAILCSATQIRLNQPASLGSDWEWINGATRDSVIARKVLQWLESLSGQRGELAEPRQRERTAIEALHRKVTLLVTENDDLLRLVNDYADQVERHKGELTEAQIEVRTLRAVLAQVDGYNQTLLLELSKRKVDKHTASLTVRAMMKAVDLAMTGAVTIGATYAGTIAAQPPATLERIDAARIEVVATCDQTIQVIGGPFANIGEEMTQAIETD